MRSLSTSLILSSLSLTAALSAQTSAVVHVGATGDVGCQASIDGRPLLTGSVAASAEFAFEYDATTGRLRLIITNTSPIVAGEATPLLTRAWFNLPDVAVTGASIVGQSAAGGAAPAWVLDHDSNARSANCLGDFDVEIGVDGNTVRNGLANAAATNVGGPAGAAVVGPLELQIQLTGPGIHTLNASAIAFGYSQSAAAASTNVAAKFQAAGIGAEESGVLGNATNCACGAWANGPARLGQPVTICQEGEAGCHDCVWVSLEAGPTPFGAPFNLIAPIGLPILAVFDFDFPSNNRICFELDVPNDANLVGLTLYFATLTHPAILTGPQDLSFCGPMSLTIQN
ncbi:MAG: hypothetical protein AB7T19_04965 [Planctomycetota bacterium]